MQITTIIVYVAIFLLIVVAVKTALPNAEASKPCLLGYKAACSFTPISTIILAAAAIAIYLLTKNLSIT
jgi:energy-converting hydrogenase Eha subunit A